MTVLMFLFLLIVLGASVKLEGGIEIRKRNDDRRSKFDQEDDESS
jgi:hypothetical protein